MLVSSYHHFKVYFHINKKLIFYAKKRKGLKFMVYLLRRFILGGFIFGRNVILVSRGLTFGVLSLIKSNVTKMRSMNQ